MGTFRVPEVLLLVLTHDTPIVANEVGYIAEFVAVFLNNCTRYDADIEFFGKGFIGVEILLPFRAEWDEAWIVRKPIGEMVLGQHHQIARL